MRALVQGIDLRRAGSITGVLLFVAVVTGPDGTQDKPWSGLQHSLLAGRVIGFLIAAVVIIAAVELGGANAAQLRASAAMVRSKVRAQTSRTPIKWSLYALLAAVVLLYPLTISNFWRAVSVNEIGIFVLLALGLNVVVGFAGLLDLGFIAFFAVGSYTTAYFTGKLPGWHPPFDLNPFFIFPIAAIVAMLAGLLLGAPTLRLRGDYLAIVTLGFGEIVRITAVNTDSVGGPRGTQGVPHFSIDLGFFHYKWTLSQLPYYYLVVVVIAILWFLLRRLEDSRIGRAWTAIREDEVAAEANGIPTLKLKLMAFAIGASTSGFAGVIYASKGGSFTPESFILEQSILVLVVVIFGGMGSIPGVALGAVILGWLPNFLRDYVRPTDRYIYYGALLVAMMIFRPQGVLPSRRRAREIALSEGGMGGADAMGPIGGEA